MKKSYELFFIFFIFFALIYVSNSQDEIVINELPNDLIYIGIGPEIQNINLLNPILGEIEDTIPTYIELGDEYGIDSMKITILARQRNDTIRVVMFTTQDSILLSSISYKRIPGTSNYEPNLSGVPDSSWVTPTADSLIMNTLKWTSIGTYLTIIQLIKHETEQRDEQECTLCINHDLKCTPGWVNRIKVFALCYGFTWIDLRNCCKQHDIEYWCAANILDKVASDLMVSNCFFHKILWGINDKVPWWCGGSITGSIAGVIQSTIVAVLTEAVLNFVYPGEGRVGGGYDENSCLCGGTETTYWCEGDNGLLCEGTPTELEMEGITCSCTSPFETTMQVLPDIVGSSYDWVVTGGINIQSVNGNQISIIANSSGSISVTCISSCGIVTLKKDIIIGGPPPIPKLNSYKLLCYPDNKRSTITAYSPCATSYVWDISGGITLIENIGSSIIVETNNFNLIYCIKVKAVNACGESDWFSDCSITMPCNKRKPGQIGPRRYGKTENDLSEEFNIYPNPTNGYFKITLPDKFKFKTYIIIGILGNILQSGKIINSDHLELNIKELHSGTYLLILEKNDLTKIQKKFYVLK